MTLDVDAPLNPNIHILIPFDYRCCLGVTSLFLMQWARVRSPVGSISWLRFFRGFPSTVRQMSGNLGYIRPRLSYGLHISSKPYIIRLRTASVSDHSCSTWQSLSNKQQPIFYIHQDIFLCHCITNYI